MMPAALFWVLLFVGYLLACPIAWRIGYRAGRRAYSELPAEDWDGHVDQALAVFQDAAEQVSPADWPAAMRGAGGSVSYLRDRRDKLN